MTYCLRSLVLEFHMDALLCSNLGNQNSDVGHIKNSRGPQVPQPCFIRYFAYNQPLVYLQSVVFKPTVVRKRHLMLCRFQLVAIIIVTFQEETL